MKIATLLLFFLLSGSAQAAVEVTCIDESCLTSGWRITDLNSMRSNRVSCANESCENEGWIETDHFGRVRYEAICWRDGCFKSGWSGFVSDGRRLGALLVELTCLQSASGQDSDCLKYGWEVTDGFNVNKAICREEDCRKKGWDLWTPGGIVRVRCKEKGCFTDGWHQF